MELEDALSSNDSEIYFASASCGPRRVSIGDCFWSSLSKAGRCFLLRLEALYIPVQRRLRQDKAISRMASVSVFYPTDYVSRDVNYGLKLKRVNAPVTASGVVCVGFHRVFVPPVDYEVLRHPKPLTMTLEDFFDYIAPDASSCANGNWADGGLDLPGFLASSAHCKREGRGKANVIVMSASAFNRLQRYSAAHELYGWSREQVLGYIGDGCLAQCTAGTKVFFCRRKHPLYHVNRHSSRQESLAPKRKGELRTLARRSEQECINELRLRVKTDVRSLRQKRMPGGDCGTSGTNGRTGRGRPKRFRQIPTAPVPSVQTDRQPTKTARHQRRKKAPSTAAVRAASAAASAPSRKRRLARRKKGRPPKKRPKLETVITPIEEPRHLSPPPAPSPILQEPSPPAPPPSPPVPLPPTQSQTVPPRKRGRPRKTAAPVFESVSSSTQLMSTQASSTTETGSTTLGTISIQDSIDSIIENVLSQEAVDSFTKVKSKVLAEDEKLPQMTPSPTHLPPPPPSPPYQLRLETISPAAPALDRKIDNEPVSPPACIRSDNHQMHHTQNLIFQQPHQLMQFPFSAVEDPAAFLQQWTPRHMQLEAAAAAAAAAAASASSVPASSPFQHHLHHQHLQHLQHFQQLQHLQQLQQFHQQQQKLAAPQPQSMWVPQKTPCYGAPPMQMPYPGLAQAIPMGHPRFAPMQTFLPHSGATIVPVIITNPLPPLPPPPSGSVAGSAGPISSAAAAAAAASQLPHPGLFLPHVSLYHHGDS